MTAIAATIAAGGARANTQTGLALEKDTYAPRPVRMGAPLDFSMPLPDGWMVATDDTAIDGFAPAVSSVVMTRAPVTLDVIAPNLHATRFENRINAAVTGFLNARQTQA